jgi:hypothetical protein
LQFTSNIAHGPAQGLMHDRVPLSQMGLASGVKNFLDMSGMVISSLVMARLIASENPDPLPGLMVVAALMIAGPGDRVRRAGKRLRRRRLPRRTARRSGSTCAATPPTGG